MPRGSEVVRPLDRIRWLDCTNDAGEEIPAFGVVFPFGASTNGIISAIKPPLSAIPVYFAGDGAIATGGRGIVSNDLPAYALYDTADGTPVVGEIWGAKAGEFKLRKGINGYVIVGGVTEGRVMVTQNTITTAISFLKCLNATPVSGRFEARLQTENADGTLSDPGGSQNAWLRHENNAGLLILDEIYGAKFTGVHSDGLPVYTIVDEFNETVRYQDLSGAQTRTLYLELGPTNCWEITRPGTRRTLIKRLLRIEEIGGSPSVDDVKKVILDSANAWALTGANGDATIVRVLNIREGSSSRTTNTYQVDFDADDFNVTATASDHATINTEGYTGDFYVLTNCIAGVLKKRLLSFVRGLLKTVGAEIDL